MNSRTLQNVTDDIAHILQAIDEIGLQAEALGGLRLPDAGDSLAETRRTLDAVAANLDRIVAKAREVELLVAVVPEAGLAGDLYTPAAQLREAITSLVVCAYGAAAGRMNAAPA